MHIWSIQMYYMGINLMQQIVSEIWLSKMLESNTCVYESITAIKSCYPLKPDPYFSKLCPNWSETPCVSDQSNQ